MIKAALVGSSVRNFESVYAQRQMEALNARVELLPGIFESIENEALKDVEVIFTTWGMFPCTREQIRTWLPNLKELYYGAGSVQHFALPFLQEGVRVFSAWKANGVPVAEFTFSQIMLALKGFFTVQQLTRTNRKAAQELVCHYPGGFDVKVGLLGCGAVGSGVARLLKHTDVEVLAYDPFLPDTRAAELGVQKVEMSEIFAQCDVVSNHLANLPTTVGIIKREHLLSMKPYSTFINTGRGPQLDEKDLFDMLTLDPTRWALLDVMTDEVHSDANPLNALPNCRITPHIAGSTGNEVRRMAEYMIGECGRILAGEAPLYEVSESMLDTMA